MSAEPNTPQSYANALLTTMARGQGGPVTIVPGLGVPSLASLATASTELEWIASLPFTYGNVDANRVIATILFVSGWRFWHLSPRSYELSAVVLAPGGGSTTPVRFRVERRWRAPILALLRGRWPIGPITITRADLVASAA